MEHNVCSMCGSVLSETEVFTFNGQTLCEECLEDNTVFCSDCGTRIWNEDNAGTDNFPLCQHCYEQSYTNCCHCGRPILFDDACYQEFDSDDNEPYCQRCYNALSKDAIHDYYYKPEPIFRGIGPRYMGVELEIDGSGEYTPNARQILDIANGSGELIYCKHDGSLDDGFEIVTHPMSLEFHRHGMPWQEVMHRAVELGYLSHQAGTCGLHVHVSRAAFGVDEEVQDMVIARILYFVEKHWNELLKFSRRTQRQLDRWAARYGYKDRPAEMMEHVKKGYGNRYTCVNLTNRATIEFRIFRGTLKYNTLIATLELVDRICDVALALPDDALKALSWSDFVSGCTEPELIQYLKERRLYLNEPVNSEVDI